MIDTLDRKLRQMQLALADLKMEDLSLIQVEQGETAMGVGRNEEQVLQPNISVSHTGVIA